MRRYMMAIYNTYKDAVLANGGTKGVYNNLITGWFHLDTSNPRSWVECNPADYLETLESFLASGKWLADGDRYIENDGEVVPITSDGDEKSVSEFAINTPRKGDENLFILQAAADQVETPKKKGAFDAMTDTAPQQFDWNNGDPCIFGAGDRSGIYVTYDAYNEGHVIYSGGEYHYVLGGDFRKPETPEEREERERLEAAYYLYCKCGIQHETVSFEKFKADDDCYPCVWLDIVDETGYRKDRKQ